MTTFEKLGMFDVISKEMDQMKEFYTSTLGCKVVVENKYGEMHFIKMIVPGGLNLNLIKKNEYAKSEPGSAKLYLFTSDIDKSYKDIVKKGVKPNIEIQEQQWDRKVKQFDFNDPDGNSLVLVQFLD